MTLPDARSRRDGWIGVREAFGIESPELDDKPLHAVRRLALLAGGCVMPLLTALLAHYPDLVERVYADALGQRVQRFLTGVSGVVGFSIIETLVIGLLLSVLCLAIGSAVQVMRRRRHALNAAACGLLRLGAFLGFAALTAYAAWAFNFARTGLLSRQHWTKYAETTDTDDARQDLVRDCAQLVELANREYESGAGSADPGQPSAPAGSVAVLDAAIERAYARVADRLQLHPSFAAARGRAKPVRASVVLDALLVTGFYSPWTGEANYSRDVPAYMLPHTIAHEKAHQRVITNEDEANFFGFLACIYSDNAYIRYSGYLFAQQQLLEELRRVNPGQAKRLIGLRDRGIQRDLEEGRRFVTRHSGRVSAVSYAVNDAYLKVNRTAGMRSYAMSARLIFAYSRAFADAFTHR